MSKISKTSIIGWFMVISAIGMGLEILFNWWLLIPLIVGAYLLYKGKMSSKNRNLNLIIGFSLIAIPILSSGFLKFFIIAAIIYGLLEYSKTKKQTQRIIVHTVEPEQKSFHVKKKVPFIKNVFAGSQRVVNEVFEWDDINIQCGFGDTVVDLGMTMLPQGESTVVIRNLVGNIQLIIPIDATVIINHSVISGKLTVYDEETELFNSNIIYYPEIDQPANRTIKIITNLIIGNLEVKRV